MREEQVCPYCASDNWMERKGLFTEYSDIVCLDCGRTWTPKKRYYQQQLL